MNKVDISVLSQLHKVSSKSHKGENGRALIIAGSDKYHGSLVLTTEVMSRIVDLVYIHSIAKNLKLIDKLKSQTATFITIDEDELWSTIASVDVIVIGPGLDKSEANKKILEKILKKGSEKKAVIDATALHLLNPELLHNKCIVTPHAQEFESLFKCVATPENALKMSQQFDCVIVLKGSIDYIADGSVVYANQTGNAGMTKGGTGDVLAGLIGGLLAQNDMLLSALAGTYINGMAGDRLYEKKGVFYNAQDLIEEIGVIWKQHITK